MKWLYFVKCPGVRVLGVFVFIIFIPLFRAQMLLFITPVPSIVQQAPTLGHMDNF